MNKFIDVVGYVRVSTKTQASDGVSLDVQRSKISQWADLHDSTLIATFSDEGLSGADSSRPGLQSALECAEERRAALIVYSISRLSRSTLDLLTTAERLRDAGSHLISLSEQIDTTSAAGRMVFSVLGAVAQFERDLISERTVAALAHKKAKGERTGSIPFGYQLADDGVNLIANLAEQRAIKLAKGLRGEGMTLRAISAELASRGAFNRHGRPFNPKSVASMLKAASGKRSKSSSPLPMRVDDATAEAKA